MERKINTSKIQLYIKDTGRSHTLLGKKRLMSYLKGSLKAFEKVLDYPQAEVSLVFCGTKKIRSLNKTYRNKDKKTDVLSFPVFPSLRNKKLVPQGLINLGDIFICKDVAKAQAEEFKISLEEEIVHLFIHGLLHLYGYDHEISEKEEKLMFTLEEKLVKKTFLN
ncbi:MAG: rRNA maturation RNase YbeY [Epsilonproteobacteria bacterium]|nr:MAG: rRNA maturation RNase YbeY [Campylobacterota bacterium]RLA66702.1 MAG: rRNA maturation RNase YbeY [Campylobacterota bacterium]